MTDLVVLHSCDRGHIAVILTAVSSPLHAAALGLGCGNGSGPDVIYHTNLAGLVAKARSTPEGELLRAVMAAGRVREVGRMLWDLRL